MKLEESNTMYEEKQPMVALFLPINFVAIAVLGYVSYVEYYLNDFQLGWLIFNAVIAGVLVAISVVFRQLRLVVTDHDFEFGYGPFKKKMFTQNMVDVRVEKFRFKNFLGYGIRYGMDKTVGFVARGGSGVAFTELKTKKKVYVSTDQPDELMQILLSAGAKKAE